MAAEIIILSVIAQIFFHAVLTVLFESTLEITSMDDIRRYRLAFLFSSAFTFIPWYRYFFSLHPLGMILAGIAGAFLGGLIATRRKTALWENNSPPSPEIEKAVLQAHRQVIETPLAIPMWKRLFDLFFAVLAASALSPVWALAAFLIWFEDPGSILFVKNSVGKDGVNFHQFKFRTMIQGAEEATGPILASIHDERVLKTGRLLRKSHLDELPQLINIFKGEMSLVGPRPQRTVLVYQYIQKIPEYVERHRVLPGIAGLAQVAGSYYMTPRQKLRFDCLYIRNISMGFDIKLLCLACLIAIWYRWQKNWNGRLPRWMMH
ncbi:MAG: sugar transferase [Chloroflexi bacterium]|nr:sugar transferase [Chloroflexota bacterium]